MICYFDQSENVQQIFLNMLLHDENQNSQLLKQKLKYKIEYTY